MNAIKKSKSCLVKKKKKKKRETKKKKELTRTGKREV